MEVNAEKRKRERERERIIKSGSLQWHQTLMLLSRNSKTLTKKKENCEGT